MKPEEIFEQGRHSQSGPRRGSGGQLCGGPVMVAMVPLARLLELAGSMGGR
jgi:hypothetical protein